MYPSLRPPQKVCSRIGLALFVMMLAWFGSVIIISAIVGVAAATSGGSLNLSNFEFMNNLWFLLALNDIPLYAIAMPIFLLILRTIPDGPVETRPTVQRVHIGWFLVVLAFCFGATYLFSFLTDFVSEAITFAQDMPSSGTDSMDGLLTGGDFLPQFIFIACVPAVGEEFIFRYMLRKKMRGCGDKIYILFSSLCFGMFHANFAQIFYAFVVGAVFAWVYVQTGKLWISMVLHFCINFFAILTPYLAQDTVVWLVVTLVIVGLMILAIVLFIVFFRRINRGFLPPTEAGWPYTPPKGAVALNPQPAAVQTPAYTAAAPPAQAGRYLPAAPTGPPQGRPVYHAHQGYSYAAGLPAAPAPQPVWNPAPAWQAPPQPQPLNPYYSQPGYPPQAPAYAPQSPYPAYAAQPRQPAYTGYYHVTPYPSTYNQVAQQGYPAAQSWAGQAYLAPGYPQASPYGAPPAYGQPAYQPAYPPRQPAYAAGPYQAAPAGYYPVYQRPKGPVSLCIGNVGMILFLVLTGLITVASLFIV